MAEDNGTLLWLDWGLDRQYMVLNCPPLSPQKRNWQMLEMSIYIILDGIGLTWFNIILSWQAIKSAPRYSTFIKLMKKQN